MSVLRVVEFRLVVSALPSSVSQALRVNTASSGEALHSWRPPSGTLRHYAVTHAHAHAHTMPKLAGVEAQLKVTIPRLGAKQRGRTHCEWWVGRQAPAAFQPDRPLEALPAHSLQAVRSPRGAAWLSRQPFPRYNALFLRSFLAFMTR